MFDSLLNAFRAPDIRRRVLYVLGLLIVFRMLAAVPVPGIDKAQLEAFVQGNPLFGCSTCSRAVGWPASRSWPWA